jgi:hypothetical protein
MGSRSKQTPGCNRPDRRQRAPPERGADFRVEWREHMPASWHASAANWRTKRTMSRPCKRSSWPACSRAPSSGDAVSILSLADIPLDRAETETLLTRSLGFNSRSFARVIQPDPLPRLRIELERRAVVSEFHDLLQVQREKRLDGPGDFILIDMTTLVRHQRGKERRRALNLLGCNSVHDLGRTPRSSSRITPDIRLRPPLTACQPIDFGAHIADHRFQLRRFRL